MTTKPSLLIISFSRIDSDARVLKQVRGFADDFAVTTCGFGPRPDERVEHIELPVPELPRVRRLIDEGLVALRLHRAAYWSGPTTSAARSALRGRRFDAVIANDLDTAGVAVSLFGGDRVHCDLHEYWPALRGEDAKWMRFRSKLYVWLLRTYVRRAASVTTVSARIADEYRRVHGIHADVVTNATPRRHLEPQEVAQPLRLVYSGAGSPDRGIESLIDAAAATTTPVTLDLFLTAARPEYLASLRERIDRVQAPARIQDPVPYSELLRTLNGYDIGIYQPKPINLNHAYALPNKLFDFIQARLGLVIGPAEEMARVVREHGVGVVTADFTAESLRRALDDVTVEDVRRWKQASHAASDALSAERQQQTWTDAVHRIAGTGER